MGKSRNYWIAVVLVALTAPEALCQAAVDTKLEGLEEKVQVLERRIAALEAQLRERAAAAPIASDKVPWRKLKKGMSKEEVELLLGSPTDVSEYGTSTTWRYKSLGGIGFVRFSESGRAEGWGEP